MIRAFNNEKFYIQLSSIGGLIVTTGVIIFNVIFPLFEAKILYNAGGWSHLILMIAIPLTILGLLRFFLVPEKYPEATGKEDGALKMKDIAAVLKTNKYIFLIMLIGLVAQIYAGMGVTNYYFIYVVGNVGLAGIMGLVGVIPMLTLAFYPALLKKMTVRQLIQFGILFMIPGAILAFIAKGNIPLLIVSGIFNGISNLPLSYMSGLLIIDCASYNEWKGIRRMEATMSSMNGFAQKVGQALGSYLMGALLTAAGFNGALKTQAGSAVLMLRLLNSFIPLTLMMIVFFALFGWKLDKVKPQMEKEIKERRAAQS